MFSNFLLVLVWSKSISLPKLQRHSTSKICQCCELSPLVFKWEVRILINMDFYVTLFLNSMKSIHELFVQKADPQEIMNFEMSSWYRVACVFLKLTPHDQIFSPLFSLNIWQQRMITCTCIFSMNFNDIQVLNVSVAIRTCKYLNQFWMAELKMFWNLLELKNDGTQLKVKIHASLSIKLK